MQLSSLLGHSAELYRIITKSHQPPDKVTKEYLKRKKYLGSNDRKFISEVVFIILRLKSMPEYCLSTAPYKDFIVNINIEPDEQKSLSDFLIIVFGIFAALLSDIQLNSLKKLIYSNDNFSDTACQAVNQRFSIDKTVIYKLFSSIRQELKSLVASAENLDISNELPPIKRKLAAIRYAQQEWVISSLIESGKYSSDELKNLFKSFFFPAPLTLRINAPAEHRQEIFEECKKFDSEAKKTDFSPSGIVLSKRFDFNTLELYKKGFIEIQDEGSQLITIALNPTEGEKILDACAGAGGKSLHIASLVNDNASVIASDVDLRKLKELNKRSKRAGVSSVTTFLSKNINKSQIKVFDKVLVDSPCSGMGTIRRNPMPKWKLTPAMLEKYNRKQIKILEDYSQYVAPGGILLYSTCSIMPQENEMIVEEFLENHTEFSGTPLQPAFDKFGIVLPGLGEKDFQYQLLPSVHNCDGFYFAKFIKEF